MIIVISTSQSGLLMLNLNEVPKALLGLQNRFKNPWNFFTLTFSQAAVLLMEAVLGVPNTYMSAEVNKFLPQCLVGMLQL